MYALDDSSSSSSSSSGSGSGSGGSRGSSGSRCSGSFISWGNTQHWQIIREVLSQLYTFGGCQRSLETYRAGNHVVWSTEQLLGSRGDKSYFVT